MFAFKFKYIIFTARLTTMTKVCSDTDQVQRKQASDLVHKKKKQIIFPQNKLD